MLLEKRIEQFRTELTGELTRFRVGSRIYTHRELVERFHVSRRVVDGALARLEADGILEVRPQSGIYLLHKKEKFQLALFHPDYPAETLEKHRNCLAAECERQAGVFDFAEVAYDYRADIAELVGQASADAIVLIPPARLFTPAEIAGLLAVGKPVFVWQRHLVEAGIPTIDGGCEFAAFAAGEYLLRHGHRRLALLIAEPLCGDVRRIADNFLRFGRFHRCGVRVIDCKMSSGDYPHPHCREVLAAELAIRRPEFTGLFVVTSVVLPDVYAVLAEAGLRVPNDLSVIGYGNCPAAERLQPPPATVELDIAGYARQLVARLRKWAGTNLPFPPESIATTPALIPRQSVRNNDSPSPEGI